MRATPASNGRALPQLEPPRLSVSGTRGYEPANELAAERRAFDALRQAVIAEARG